MQKNITHILPPKVELRSNISNLKSFSTQLQCSSKYEIVWTNVVKILLIFFIYLSSLLTLSLSSIYPLPLAFLFSQPHSDFSLSFSSLFGGGRYCGSSTAVVVVASGVQAVVHFLVLSWIINCSYGCGNWVVVGCIEGGFGCALKVVEGCSDWVVLDVILKLIIRKNKRCDIEKIVK